MAQRTPQEDYTSQGASSLSPPSHHGHFQSHPKHQGVMEPIHEDGDEKHPIKDADKTVFRKASSSQVKSFMDHLNNATETLRFVRAESNIVGKEITVVTQELYPELYPAIIQCNEIADKLEEFPLEVHCKETPNLFEPKVKRHYHNPEDERFQVKVSAMEAFYKEIDSWHAAMSNAFKLGLDECPQWGVNKPTPKVSLYNVNCRIPKNASNRDGTTRMKIYSNL